MLRCCVNAILKDYHILGSKSARDYYAMNTRRHAEVIAHLKGKKRRSGYFAKDKLCYLLPQNPFLDSDDVDNDEGNGDDETNATYCCVRGICAIHNWKRGIYDRIRISVFLKSVPPKHRGMGKDNHRHNHAEA